MLQSVQKLLADKYSLTQGDIPAEEKVELATAIKKIVYPHSVKDILCYVNEEVSSLLASSSNTILREWGVKCKDFYENNPLNKYIEPETGLIVAKRGGISQSWGCWHEYFSGQAVYNVNSKSWTASPITGYSNHGSDWPNALNVVLYRGDPYPNDNGGFFGRSRGLFRDPVQCLPKFTPINPVNFAQFQIDLISPIHVAAAIGNSDLLEELIKNGFSVTDNYNKARILPLHFAATFCETSTINMLLANGTNQEAFEIAVEVGNFEFIHKFIKSEHPITDKVLETALTRDRDLHRYLDLVRKLNVQTQIDAHGIHDALKVMLDYNDIPIQSLVDIICMDSTVINHVDSEEANTILHSLAIDDQTAKVAALLEAIYQSSFTITGGVEFDIDLKNKQNQSILDIALSKSKNDLVSAILLYNPAIDQAQQAKLINAGIDIPSIHQTKEKRMRDIISKQGKQIEKMGGRNNQNQNWNR